MLLPYLDMGNPYIYNILISIINLNKCYVRINTYLIYKPYEVHTLDSYSRASLFSLKYQRKYNSKYLTMHMMHISVHNGNIEL